MSRLRCLARWPLAALLMGAAALVAGCGAGTSSASTPAASSLPPTDGPRLTLSETAYDFGVVPTANDMRQARWKTFRLTNTGSAPLKLRPEPQIETLEGC